MHESPGRARRVHAAPVDRKWRYECVDHHGTVTLVGVVAVEVSIDQPDGRIVTAPPAVPQDCIPARKRGVTQVRVSYGQGLVDFQDGGAMEAGVHRAELLPGDHQLGRL